MAGRLLSFYGEGNGVRCSAVSCRKTNPKLYDDQTELYFCDRGCFTEYLTDNVEDFVDWYEELNLHEVD